MRAAGSRKRSFRRQVLRAAALLAGFYLLAGLILAALVGTIVALWATDLPNNLWITAACGITAIALLGSLLPRRRPKFEPPGPRIAEDDAPRLHALVREVAEATGQEPPADVYLDASVNAAVAETGGLFGAGGGRVMIVGLPLLDCLTVGELRAVLAHEFGHYYGGDLRIGSWFFRTHDAIARTVANLEATDSIWQDAFEAYGRFFLRRSASIKREQEFMADELSARAAGRDAAISSMHAAGRASAAFDLFWGSEMAPVLDAGLRAPMLEGFRRFRSEGEAMGTIDAAVAVELAHGETDPYSTHPSDRERLAALGALDDGRGASPGDERPAIELLDDPERAERDLLVALFGERVDDFDAVGWDEVPGRVFVPGWRDFVQHYWDHLAGIAVADLPQEAAAGGLAYLGRQLLRETDPDAGPIPEDVHTDLAASALDVGLALALYDHGWQIETSLGNAIVMRRGAQRIKPFGTAHALASGELAAEEWAAICAGAHIGHLYIGVAGPAGDGADLASPTAPTAETAHAG